MTTITSATNVAPPSIASRNQIAGNFTQFLQLLTTQLRNQNPLDPLDTNQFTQQLVQFASVEQQLQTNATLSSLLKSTQASTATGALGFVGAQITADGATSRLSGGGAEWRLTAPRTAAEAVVTIADVNGNVVATDKRTLAAGTQSYQWNGRTSTGRLAPDGDYTITVTAKDAVGQPMAVTTDMTGIVDAVDLSGDVAVLAVGSLKVPVGNVKSIRRPS